MGNRIECSHISGFMGVGPEPRWNCALSILIIPSAFSAWVWARFFESRSDLSSHRF